MRRSWRVLRVALLASLSLALALGPASLALAEEGAEEATPELTSEGGVEQGDPNDFTGTYEIGGTTGTGAQFTAVIQIWDRGTNATVRGVIPKLGRSVSWSFPVKQVSDSEYQITGSVWIPAILSASGAATVTRKGDGYEVGGSGTGTFLGKDGSATFGGARVSTATDGQVSTTLVDRNGNKTTTDADGNRTVIKAPVALVEPLAPEPEAEMPPVADDTKGLLIALVAMIIAVQLVAEVLMGGSVSLGDIKDTFEAGSEAVAEISASVSEGGGE